MFRKHLLLASTLALAVAVILLAASPALAQFRPQHLGGGYYGGGYHGGYGYYSGHYGSYYPHYGYYSGRYGYSPSYTHYGLGYYPGYYGYYRGYSPWYYRGYYYSPGYYAYSALPSTYQAFYPPASAAPAGGEQVVHFDIRVPDDAKIWFDDEKTTQTGPSREFVSPPLASGREYSYEVRAQWTENGREVTQSRRVAFRAGERVSIAFPEKTPEKVQ